MKGWCVDQELPRCSQGLQAWSSTGPACVMVNLLRGWQGLNCCDAAMLQNQHLWHLRTKWVLTEAKWKCWDYSILTGKTPISLQHTFV